MPMKYDVSVRKFSNDSLNACRGEKSDASQARPGDADDVVVFRAGVLSDERGVARDRGRVLRVRVRVDQAEMWRARRLFELGDDTDDTEYHIDDDTP